jgi:hypothetical protein
MRIIRDAKNEGFVFADLDDPETWEELEEWIWNEYRDDETFSEKRIEETLNSILKNRYHIEVDGDTLCVEIEEGLGNLNAIIEAIEV